MTRNRKLLLGGVALAVIAAGGVAASAHRGGFGGHHGMGGAMGFGGGICRGDPAEMADHMLVRLQYKVKPTDAQKAAFEDLRTAARAAAAKAKAGCPPVPAQSADGTPPPRKSPTERLALMEAGLTAQLDAIRTVRPAAEKFYATLSDDQKKQLTEREHGGWMGGRDGERGGHHMRGERGERGEGPGAAPQAAPDKK